ncbi:MULTISPECIES: carbon storage regulator [Lachnospiraceae]
MEVYRMLKLSLKEGEYVNIGDNIRVVYACTG